MNSWNDIYVRNKELDNIFNKKYSSDSMMFQKNCIELLTELGEFANETKCFKYWSIKEPNRREVLEEYADCITMILYFFNYLDIEIDNLPEKNDTKNIIYLFNYLFEMSSKLINECKEETVKDIFVNLLYLGELFEFTEQEEIEACKNKHDKILKRLNSDY